MFSEVFSEVFKALLLLCLCVAASACEVVLTHAEIAADRARAVEFFRMANSEFGGSVTSAGDVNGDGFDDFAIAAPRDGASASEGAVYLVFGRSAAEWANALFDFNASDTASWIRISGTESITFLGYYGIAHGDFNGDGLGDLFIGSSKDSLAYVVYGHSGAWNSFETADIKNGTVPGFVISGNHRFVGNAGDMNGDGIDDLLVTKTNPGFSFVVFGLAGANRSAFSTQNINGVNGFALTDGTAASLGDGVADSVGDVNGDGLADLAIGSSGANSNAGRVYIVFARNVSATGQQWPVTLNLTADLDGNAGFIIDGPAAGFSLGSTVTGAGDVNADGFSDIFIGSSSFSTGAWILFGHSAPWTSPFNVSQLDGMNGFHFASSNEHWGCSGGGAGDVNGDGFDDVLIGGEHAYNHQDTTITGAVAILFGRNGSWPAELGREDAVGSVGFLVDGPSELSAFGYSARGAGDVNGDGLADFIAGAHNTESTALVFGVADDHCAVCSNTTDDCLACDDGFFLNGTLCEAAHFQKSSSSFTQASNGESVQMSSSSSSSSIAATVVVIETGSGGSVGEVAQLLGVDVGQISVVEITPGTFEVTVINEEVAHQLVTLIEQCQEKEQ